MLEIVILAAGASTRLGKSKQLLKINDETLIHRAANMASKLSWEFGLKHPMVVVGKDQDQVGKSLTSLVVSTVYNPQWTEGMGLSIAAGIKQLGDNCTAVLLMTCDQVLLDINDYKQLVVQWLLRPKNIIASSYEGTTGVPVIFPAEFFQELKHLEGDKGARGLLHDHAEQIIRVDLPGAAYDLDTADDEVVIREMLSKE